MRNHDFDAFFERQYIFGGKICRRRRVSGLKTRPKSWPTGRNFLVNRYLKMFFYIIGSITFIIIGLNNRYDSMGAYLFFLHPAKFKIYLAIALSGAKRHFFCISASKVALCAAERAAAGVWGRRAPGGG